MSGNYESNRATLEKAIKKAIKNGWTFKDWTDADDFNWEIIESDDSDSPILVETTSRLGDYTWHPYIVIFSHDFAKALWDDKTYFCVQCDYEMPKVEAGESYHDVLPIWQWHLQQTVIADDPIKYLGEHLE